VRTAVSTAGHIELGRVNEQVLQDDEWQQKQQECSGGGGDEEHEEQEVLHVKYKHVMSHDSFMCMHTCTRCMHMWLVGKSFL
jgi:hypothetical protein